MTQLLTVSTLKVAPTNSTDKAVHSAVSNKENESFASELNRRINDPQRSAKDKTTKVDDSTDNKQIEPAAKAEKSEAKDGKKLPPEKSDKKAESIEKDTDKVDGKEHTAVISDKSLTTEEDETDPLLVVSIAPAPVTDTKKSKVVLEAASMVEKSLTQTSEIDAKKSILAGQSSPLAKADLSETHIRADILQAIQKQNVEGEVGATEKVKSMLNMVKTSEQLNTVNADALAALKQLDPQLERSSTSKLNNPLAFSTLSGAANTVAGASTPPTLSLDIQPQLNSAAWAKVMSSRVIWMAKEGVQQAELKLNPAHLGPLEVRLSMQNDQTNVTFIASNATARDALEQALPRLRESFNESGLALNNAEVSHQEQSSQGSEQDESFQNGNNMAQVIIESDDMDIEEANISAEKADNSIGVSVFA